MAVVDGEAREVVKGDVKAVVSARGPLVPVVRPSAEAAEQRRAARAQQATVAGWLRRMSSSRR